MSTWHTRLTEVYELLAAVLEALAVQPCALSAPDFYDIICRDFPELKARLGRGEQSLRNLLDLLALYDAVRREISHETGESLFAAEV